MFSVKPHDTIPATLHYRAWGTWDIATAIASERAILAAIAALPCVPGEHLVLSDLRELGRQSEEVVRLSAGMFARGDQGLGFAALFGEGRCREQTGAVVGPSPIGSFETLEEAEAWLRERSKLRSAG